MTVQLQISEVAKRAGVSIRTVRFYEEKGLIAPSAYTSSGIRLYSVRDVNRLVFIKRLRILGLTIEEIKTCLAPTSGPGTRKTRADRTLKLLKMQKKEAQAEITKLASLQKEINASIGKVKICSTCKLDRCPEQCPSYGQVL